MDPGTGDPPIGCDGPGVAYQPVSRRRAVDDVLVHVPPLVGRRPGSGPYQLTMGVEWAVTWDCSPGCGGGPMAPVTVTTNRPVWVAELQAITR